MGQLLDHFSGFFPLQEVSVLGTWEGGEVQSGG